MGVGAGALSLAYVMPCAELMCLGRPVRQGTFNFADGRVYTGVVVDGTAHGSGKMVYPDGNVYTGEFAAGLRDGRGVLDIANGTVYDGEWRNDVRNGIGRQT